MKDRYNAWKSQTEVAEMRRKTLMVLEAKQTSSLIFAFN